MLYSRLGNGMKWRIANIGLALATFAAQSPLGAGVTWTDEGISRLTEASAGAEIVIGKTRTWETDFER